MNYRAQDRIAASQFLQVDTVEGVFHSLQERMISSLEVLLPEGYDFSQLEKLFSHRVTDELGYGRMIIKLLEYFIRAVSMQIGRMEVDYSGLEKLTQKLEADNRNHISLEQTMKLFMDSKLVSLEKYKKEAAKYKLQIKEFNARVHLFQEKQCPRSRSSKKVRHEPRYLLKYEGVYKEVQSPVRRPDCYDPRKKWTTNNIKIDEKDSSSRSSNDPPVEFNPEASNYRYSSLDR